ncbi:MAG: hypothetical protein ABEJ75_03520 [Candidatus Nanohaloarchaea archaeon]
MVTETLTKSLLTVMGVVTGLLSLLIIRTLKHREDTSMVKIGLRPGDTIRDFQIIAGANALMLAGFLMYIYGILTSSKAFWLASKLTGVIYGGMFAAVLFRWWRRFR